MSSLLQLSLCLWEVFADIPGFFKFPQYGKVSVITDSVAKTSLIPSLLTTHIPGLFWNFFYLFVTVSSFLSPLLLVALGALSCPSLLQGSVSRNQVVQLKPRPVPLGLCVALMGSVMPLPSGPRPIPGLQPMLCNMRLPMLLSGMGGAFSPTTPEGAVEPRGAAFRLRLTSPVHREPRCPLVCLLAVFTEQLLRCPLSDRGSQCNCPCSLLEPELNHGS